MCSVLIKPFFKWTGGKRAQIPKLMARLPSDFDSKSIWVEPFIGGGAMMFHVLSTCPNIRQAVINDLNGDLINCFRMVQEKPEAVISRLDDHKHAYLYKYDKKAYFHIIRDKYNHSHLQSNVERAAMFLFLISTCFNGLYRVNKAGLFNAAFGDGCSKFPDNSQILEASKLLQHVEIWCGEFPKVAKYANQDAFFYFDPPYMPLNSTANFTSYCKQGWQYGDQVRLRGFCDFITAYNVPFMLSNSSAAKAVFEGYHIEPIKVRRTNAGNLKGRGKVTEIIVRNYDLC